MTRDALAELDARQARGYNAELDTMRALLKQMGNPEKKLKVIHVGGTNGKGSVCTYASHILAASGHKVGLYLSPHVRSLGERIQIANQPADDKTMADLAARVLDAASKLKDDKVSHFEALTAMAFQHFVEEQVDVAVVEVGLGGKLDATNVVETPLTTVVTNVSLEHTHVLGSTEEAIARQKAGILKKGVSVITGAEGLALKAIWSEAATRRAPLKVLRSLGRPEVTKSDLDGVKFKVPGRDWGKGLVTRMPGDHQAVNAALAAYAVEAAGEKGLAVDPKAYAKGIEAATMPARLQVIKKKPAFIVDGAHNPDACKTVKAWIQKMGFERVYLLYGVMSDKDFGQMTEIMAPMAQEVFVTQPPTPRGLNAKALAGEARRFCSRVRTARDLETAIRTLVGTAGPNDCILVFGSLYLAGAVLDLAPKVLE